MKLLYCTRCHDVKKLTYKRRACQCSASSGYYREDGLNAVVNGLGLIIGINNQSLLDAYAGFLVEPERSKDLVAWLCAEPAAHIEYKRKSNVPLP
jgi:hypothetical protein